MSGASERAPDDEPYRMKKHLFLALRLLMAIAGIAFIAFTLTWRDSVVLPAGYRLPSGAVLSQETRADVDASTPLADEDSPVIPVRVRLSNGETELTQIRREELGDSASEPRFRHGVVSTLRDADYALLAGGLLLMGIMWPMQALRWLMLLRCRGLDVSFGKAFRLTMVGQFFNFCMPGMTGGDVVKAYYAARHSENRGAAVMSVIFDRLAGLIGLILLAGLVGLTMLHNDLVWKITLLVWLGMLGIVVASAFYFSHHARQWLRIEQVIAKLPGRSLIGRIDAAAAAYSSHKRVVFGATLLSLPIHLINASATAMAGYALGMEHALPLLLTVIPVLLLAGAMPLTYQGLGVMEGLALAMLLQPGLATNNQIVGMLLILRLYLVAWALLGSLELLRGDVHLFPAAEAADEVTGLPEAPPA